MTATKRAGDSPFVPWALASDEGPVHFVDGPHDGPPPALPLAACWGPMGQGRGRKTMPIFSANLNFLFGELPFLERFEASRKARFHFVEYMFPYDHDPATLADLLKANGLRQVLIQPPCRRLGGRGQGFGH